MGEISLKKSEQNLVHAEGLIESNPTNKSKKRGIYSCSYSRTKISPNFITQKKKNHGLKEKQGLYG